MYRRFFVSLLLAVATLAVAATAQAQGQALTGAGPVRNGIAYTGPGDIVSGATAWYGLRAYSRAVAATGTQSAVDLRRSSDSATCTAKIGTNGGIDLTVGAPCAGATVTSFCNATSCFVSKWYDQSGNTRDASQATAASQPQLVLSVTGGKPALSFVRASPSYLFTTSGPVSSQPFSTSSVVRRTGSTTSVNNILSQIDNGGSNPQPRTLFPASANQIELFDTTNAVIATAADNSFHSVQSVFNGASSTVVVDGSSTSGTINSTGTSANLYIGISAGVANALDGNICEVGEWAAGFSAATQAALNSNQRAYYGF